VVTSLDRSTQRRCVLDCIAKVDVRDTTEMVDMIVAAAGKYGAQIVTIEQAAHQKWIWNDRNLQTALAPLGCYVRPERTQNTKFDPQWGILTVAALVNQGMYSFPWMGDDETRQHIRPLIDELSIWRATPGRRFPGKADRTMAFWLADLGLRRYAFTAEMGEQKNDAPEWFRKAAASPPPYARKVKVAVE
jgi:hypothetical protein